MATRFLFISSSGDGLPIAYRMQEEGADIAVYVHNPRFRNNYTGLLKTQLTPTQMKEFPLDEQTTVLFDMVRPYEKGELCPDDDILEITQEPGHEPTVGEGVFGPLADKLRELGCKVVGMSTLTEWMELDRVAGKKLAEEVGIRVMPHKAFESVEDLRLQLGKADPDARFVVKPCGNDDLDLTYIERWPGELLEKLQGGVFPDRLSGKKLVLEPYIEGITVDEEVWWDGSMFRALNGTLEHKRFGAGDTGPNVGSSLNVVWLKQHPLVHWNRLIPFLKQSKYIGPIDATFQVDHAGNAFFLEWAFRMGFDAIFCLLSLLSGKITHFLDNGFRIGFHDDLVAGSIRLSIQPYPYESSTLRETYARAVPILGSPTELWYLDVRQGPRSLECGGSDGIIGACVAHGEEPRWALEEAERQILRSKIAADLQYRTDWQVIQEDWNKLRGRSWMAQV